MKYNILLCVFVEVTENRHVEQTKFVYMAGFRLGHKIWGARVLHRSKIVCPGKWVQLGIICDQFSKVDCQ